jgi:hypothetical protein
LSLSEELPKVDGFFTTAVGKVVDTLRNLLNNDPARLEQHLLVNDHSCEDYLLREWRWNAGKYGLNRNLRDIVETLNKVCIILLVQSSRRECYSRLAIGNDIDRQRYEGKAE